jgi:hypothetical protein
MMHGTFTHNKLVGSKQYGENPLKVKTLAKLLTMDFLWNIPQTGKEKPKDHYMELFGLVNARILIDYAQKNSWTLVSKWNLESFN